MSTDDSLNLNDDSSSADSALRRKAIEAQLAGLRPATVELDRDRLMFAAGRAAAVRNRWTHASSLVAAACLALVVGRWSVQVAAPSAPEQALIAQQPAAPSDADFAQSNAVRNPSSLLQLRLHADDLDASRTASAASSPAAVSPRALMYELLN